MEIDKHLERMNVFETETIDMETACDSLDEFERESEEINRKEVDKLLDDVTAIIDIKEIYSGLLPTISGEWDSVVNAILTRKDCDITEIGKTFYTSDLLADLPKDEPSKEMYASVMNQLICYNILNNSRTQLFGACVIKLEMSGAPIWCEEKTLAQILVHVLRMRKINAVILKRANHEVFLEVTSTDICRKDEIKSSIDYIKTILKGSLEHSDSCVHISVDVGEIISRIPKDLFLDKVAPMQEALFVGEEHYTVLEAIESEYDYIKDDAKKGEDLEQFFIDAYAVTHRLLRLRANILETLGKHNECLDGVDDLPTLAKIGHNHDFIPCVPVLELMKKNINISIDYIIEDERDQMREFIEKRFPKLLKIVKETLIDYRDTYLKLYMDITPEEHVKYETEYHARG